jgi:hypothetical protein
MIFLRHISPGCPLAGTRKDADSEVMQGLADFIINGACPALLMQNFWLQWMVKKSSINHLVFRRL